MNIKQQITLALTSYLREHPRSFYSELETALRVKFPGLKAKFLQDLLGTLHRSRKIDISLDKTFSIHGDKRRRK